MLRPLGTRSLLCSVRTQTGEPKPLCRSPGTKAQAITRARNRGRHCLRLFRGCRSNHAWQFKYQAFSQQSYELCSPVSQDEQKPMAKRTILTTIADRLLPFAAMAQEISVRGFSLTDPADVEQGIADALAHDDPVLIDAVVAERRSLCRLQSGSEMAKPSALVSCSQSFTVAPTRSSRSRRLIFGAERRCHGTNSTSPVTAAIRLHGFVSHYLSFIHDRAGSVAHGSGGAAPCDWAACLSTGFRILAQDFWRGVRARRCLGNRLGVRVWYQLERAFADVGTHPGAASVL